MKLEQAFERLGLEITASGEEVRAKWQHLRSANHPDKGGDATQFHELRQAYTIAFEAATTPKPCPRCKGSGRITQSSGFHVTSLMCPMCQGAGAQS